VSEFAQSEALKVAATLPPFLLSVWAWGSMIRTPEIRRTFHIRALAIIAAGYAVIAWRYWL
jgi:hypothetical protein